MPPPMTINSERTFESAKSHFFDTSSWGAFCDVTLTLKQARQPDSGAWVKIDDYRCRQADCINIESLYNSNC